MSLFAEIVLSPALDGMALFPLKPDGKTPATSHGQDDATADPATLAGWSTRYPGSNVGIHCAPSGLYVVDVDSGEGKDGGASWDALTAVHGHTDTLTVRTQSGGLHFYYRMPAGETLKNTASKLGRHIDTRGNGYVVAPGSIVNGRPYEIVNDAEIAELPSWIADAVRKPVPRPRTTREGGPQTEVLMPYDLADPSEVECRVVELAGELSRAADGTGNPTANRIAFMVGGYVGAGQIGTHLAHAILEGAVSGWSFRDAESERGLYATIARALSEGASSPRPWEASRAVVRAVEFDTPADYATAEEVEQADETGGGLLEEKPKPPPTDWGTDGGQARWIIGQSDVLKHVAGLGWIRWDGKRWAVVTDDQVGQAIAAFYKREFGKAAAKWAKKPTDDTLRGRASFLAKQQGTSKIKAVREALKFEVTMGDAMSRLDAHPELLNTPDGVVNLRTGKVAPHDPDLLLTKITAGSYREGFEHVDWEQAKRALPEVSLRWLQVRMGAAVTGMTAVADDAVFLHGGGSNGKSVFLNDGVVRALGDYGSIQSSDIIGQSKADAGAATPDKAELRGARLVLIEELPTEFALNTKAIKELSGTGQVRARKLYQDSMVFDMTHSLFINTNHIPNVTDTDWGTWRRLTLVPFPITFTGTPTGENERKGDRDLVRKIRTNTDRQFDAIVTWIVDGARAFLADPALMSIGKSPADDPRPGQISEATHQWRRDSDRLMAYAEEHLILDDPNAVVARTDLVWHFNRWLGAQGASKWSARLISSRMKDHPTLGGVKERFQQSADEITRPPASDAWNDTPPALPARTRVFTGVRFAPSECVCPNASHGIHSPNCTTN